MNSNRMRRVDELIKRELGTQVERQIAPELDALVTVTGVKTAPDLRQAVVSVSIMGSDTARGAALRLLQKRRVLLQRTLARNVKLKYTPVLSFRLDDRLAQADHVLALIEDLDLDEATEPVPDPVPGTAGPDSEPTDEEFGKH